jgi:hypothetical protein
MGRIRNATRAVNERTYGLCAGVGAGAAALTYWLIPSEDTLSITSQQALSEDTLITNQTVSEDTLSEQTRTRASTRNPIIIRMGNDPPSNSPRQ